MKKIGITVFVVFCFALYSLFSRRPDETISEQINNSDTTTPLPTNSNKPVVSAKMGKYKDGEYLGSVADAFYGNIQVKAVITNGNLTDVQFLQYPNGHHESIQINSRAMPILRNEAIAAGSANVDGVSRATDTSRAFIQSLTTALNKAM